MAVVSGLGAGGMSALASPVATTTTLTALAGGTTPTIITPGTVVTLTATVTAGGSPVTVGQVVFCANVVATTCPVERVVGTAQLTSAGTAILKFTPGPGPGGYQAIFMGTQANAKSASSQVPVGVSGVKDTASFDFVGAPGGASLFKATVQGNLPFAPTGTVSFIDTTNANYVLGTATLDAGAKRFSFLTNSQPIFSTGSATAVGDFNGDGFLDIAGANANVGTLTIYSGVGDGSFTAGVPFGTCGTPGPLAVGDFNEDGKLDIAESCGASGMLYMLGHGDGTFSVSTLQPAGTGSGSLVVADFNGDGHLDLAQANQSTNDVTILLGNGDGTFTATGTNPTTSTNPMMMTVGDLNGDGKADLAIASGAESVALLFGNGDGTFTNGTASTGVNGASLIAVAVADFDGDGNQDLVVGDSTHTTVTFLKGTGGGIFVPVLTPNPTGSVPGVLVVADFDGDSKADIAVGNQHDRTVTILTSHGDGSFTSAVTQAAYSGTGILSYASAGDFNADGAADLVVGTTGNAPLDVLLSISTNTATASMPANTPVGTGGHSVSVTYPGDGLYPPATGGGGSLTASPVRTTLTLGVNPATSQLGQQVVLTATLAPYTAQNHTTDGQLIRFITGTNTVGTATLQNGVATLNTTSLPAGTLQLTASFSGNVNFDSVTSDPVSTTVTNGVTLTLTTTPTTSAYGTTVTMTATLSPYTASGQTTNGETVTFFSGALQIGTATLTGGVATLNVSTLQAGTGSLTASYAGDTYFSAATSTAVSYTVTQATPTITWATPAPIVYGTALSPVQLSATGSVPGKITYNVSSNQIVSAGTSSLVATFTPTDTTNYTTATASVQLVVSRAPLTIVPVIASRQYGTANPPIDGSVTGAVAGNTFTVTGSTSATSTSPVGVYPITYTVTGDLLANYTYTPVTGSITVTQVPTTVTWTPPAGLVYGTPLSAAQLNATASVPGTFAYQQPLGTILNAGAQTLTVNFTPTDSTNYKTSTATVPITVAQATTTVTWAPPAAIGYGTPLTATQLNATATVAGTFVYQPQAGAILGAGAQTLGVTFLPTDSTNYKSSTGSTTITVTPGTLTVVPANATRAYGAANPALSGSVTGAVNGDTFTVTGATTATSTSVAGTYPITYTVTGTNVGNYTVVQATGTLTVTQAQPVLSWKAPAAIQYGTALSAAQLNASSTIPGTITYQQTAGTVLGAGSYTLTANFVPTDTANYGSSTATVPLTVTKAPLTITANNINRTFGSANPAFTGTVAGGVNGDTFVETFSTPATLGSIVGSYPIIPTVSGSAVANYAVSATNGVLTVSQAGTATTFALSNSNLTLTATVTSLSSGSPTGSVSFYVGQTLAGTGTLSNGVASFTMASFPTGNVTLTAQYSGDANFTQSSSPALFILAVTPTASSLTVSTAGTVTDALTLAVPPGYVGSVQFSCTGLPKGAACAFNPATASFTGSSNTANVTLTITTGNPVTAMVRRLPGVEVAGLLGLPGLLAMALYSRRKRRNPLLGSLLMLLVLAGVGTVLTGCGGGTTTAPTGPTSTTPAGTSTIQVVATGFGGLSQTTSVVLNVQ